MSLYVGCICPHIWNVCICMCSCIWSMHLYAHVYGMYMECAFICPCTWNVHIYGHVCDVYVHVCGVYIYSMFVCGMYMSTYGCLCDVCLPVLLLTDIWIASSLGLLNMYEHPVQVFFFLHLSLYFVHVCMCVSTYMTVRGQFRGVGSALSSHHLGLEHGTQSSRHGSKPRSHWPGV